MYCMTTKTRPKLLSILCNLFQSLVRNCLKTSYDLSSEDENTYYDLNNTKHMILKELRSRAMRASFKSNEHFNSLYQIGNYDSTNEQKEDLEDNSDFDSESESFFSAKSNFSTCSCQGQIIPHRSSLEGCKHLEGWPFGLWRRPVVLLPPLPPTPANSWMWLRRNSEPKAYSIVTC